MPESRIRILLVDDEPPLLKMMSVYLRRLGYTVVSAASTEQAWAEIEAAPDPFVLAVLDATMGGVPINDFAARILAADPGICVILASGYPVEIAALQAAAPDRVMFLHKPFSPEMLGSAVRRMIGTQEEDV